MSKWNSFLKSLSEDAMPKNEHNIPRIYDTTTKGIMSKGQGRKSEIVQSQLALHLFPDFWKIIYDLNKTEMR